MQPLIDAVYWLVLATWFGCVLASAVIPPIILRTIHNADPTLPRVLSVNLDKQHSTLLAGTVVGDVLQTLFRIQAVCCGVFLPALIGKWLIVNRGGLNVILPLIVTLLYLGAAAFLLYGWRVVWTRVMKHRDTYIDKADDPDVANAELDHFDRYSQELSAVVRNLLFILLGLLLFSAALTPAGQTFVFG